MEATSAYDAHLSRIRDQHGRSPEGHRVGSRLFILMEEVLRGVVGTIFVLGGRPNLLWSERTKPLLPNLRF